MLRDHGYLTLGIGKMHWRPQNALHGFHATILDESGRIESPYFRSDYRKWFMTVAPGKNPMLQELVGTITPPLPINYPRTYIPQFGQATWP